MDFYDENHFSSQFLVETFLRTNFPFAFLLISNCGNYTKTSEEVSRDSRTKLDYIRILTFHSVSCVISMTLACEISKKFWSENTFEWYLRDFVKDVLRTLVIGNFWRQHSSSKTLYLSMPRKSALNLIVTPKWSQKHGKLCVHATTAFNTLRFKSPSVNSIICSNFHFVSLEASQVSKFG